jgi:hypothetical protein
VARPSRRQEELDGGRGILDDDPPTRGIQEGRRRRDDPADADVPIVDPQGR